MGYLYSDEHEAYGEVVSRWVERTVRPALGRIDLDRVLDHAACEALLAEIAAGGVIDTLPRHEDGSPDWTAMCILLEEVSRASCGLAHILVFKLASIEFSAPLFSPAQREAFAGYLDGGIGVSGGLSEPGAGSNPGEIRSLATRAEGGWIINGTKLWISSATHAGAILLHCRTREPGTSEDGFGLFFVERKHGWQARAIEMMGLSIHPTCEVTFEDVFVPDIAKLDPAGKSLAQLQKILNLARCFGGAMSVGIARGAFDAALAYAGQREQFGRRIAGFQLVQEMLADMATEIDCARLLTYRALDSLQRDLPNYALEASMAKYYATEMSVRVASKAIQVHGAMGLARETGVERIMRDARMMTIPDGTSEIQKLIIGRALTGVSALRG